MRSTIVIATLGSVIALQACSQDSPSGSEADYPSYESVASLASQADVVAMVTIDRVVATEPDDGGTGDADASVAMAMWRAQVVDVMAGTVTDPTLILAWPDLAQDPIAGRSALSPGATLIVFLRQFTTKDAPGIETQTEFYVPIGGDNGVLDVEGDKVTARSPNLTSLSDAQANDARGRLVTDLDALWDVLGTSE